MVNRSTSHPSATSENPGWSPNAASAPEQQAERPQGLNDENVHQVQIHEHDAADRVLDRPRDLERAFDRQRPQPMNRHDHAGAARDDRDEKINTVC